MVSSDKKPYPAKSGNKFDFDFNTVEPPIASLAADTVTDADILKLFEQLHAANRAFHHTPRPATLASLEAISEFLAQTGLNKRGAFSRPLDLLITELRMAADPLPGNILPGWDSKQKPQAARRRAVNYIKAATTYAARSLHVHDGKLLSACDDVCDVLSAHGFSLGSARKPGEQAWTIKRWCETYSRNDNESSRFFQQFLANPPMPADASRARILHWLAQELEHLGYQSQVT
jgi:hypothetical protein